MAIQFLDNGQPWTEAAEIALQASLEQERRTKEAIAAAVSNWPRKPLPQEKLNAANLEARRLGRPLTQAEFEKAIS